MSLRITLNPYGTHAEVLSANAREPVPDGSRLLHPGERYFGISYDIWAKHQHQTVDVLALQYAAEHGSLRGNTVRRGERIQEVTKQGPSYPLPRTRLLGLAVAGTAGLLAAGVSTIWLAFSWGFLVFTSVVALVAFLWEYHRGEGWATRIAHWVTMFVIIVARPYFYPNDDPFGPAALQFIGIFLSVCAAVILMIDRLHRSRRSSPSVSTST